MLRLIISSLQTSLQASQAIRNLEGRANTLSPLAPVYCNIDLARPCSNGGFNISRDRGILTLGPLFHKGVTFPFTEIEKKYDLTPNNSDFFKFVALFRNRHVFDCQSLNIEHLLLNRGNKSVLG